MSLVIVGGNECMIREYMELCKMYNCQAKVYPKMSRGLQNLGNPDLLVLFTDTVSHKMAYCALQEAQRSQSRVARCHSSSSCALKNILEAHCS